MSYEQIINSMLIKFFCALTEILNDYTTSISESPSSCKQEEILKAISEDSFKKLIENFIKFQSTILDTVHKMQSEESISFDFSDPSDSPSPTKKNKDFLSPPILSQLKLEDKDFRWKTEPNSRLKKLDSSSGVLARNLFKQ